MFSYSLRPWSWHITVLFKVNPESSKPSVDERLNKTRSFCFPNVWSPRLTSLTTCSQGASFVSLDILVWWLTAKRQRYQLNEIYTERPICWSSERLWHFCRCRLIDKWPDRPHRLNINTITKRTVSKWNCCLEHKTNFFSHAEQIWLNFSNILKYGKMCIF